MTASAAITACLMPDYTLAQCTRGPVLIGGDDAEHHFPCLGDSYMREGFDFLGQNVGNPNTLAVCIGCNDDPSPQTHDGFLLAFESSRLPALGWITTIIDESDTGAFFDGTGTITIDDTGILHLASSPQAGGGMTQTQLTVINNNAQTLRDFIDCGGGLWSHTGDQLQNEYAWLSTVIPGVAHFDTSLPELNLTCAGTAAFFSSLSDIEIGQDSPLPGRGIKHATPVHTRFEADFEALGLTVLAVGPDDEVLIFRAPIPQRFP